MKLTSEKIEHTFMPLLQHNVKITCDSKKIREGKLLIVSQKTSYVSIVLADKQNVPKILELPYPFIFKYDQDKHQVCLDYTIHALCNNRINTQRMVYNMIRDSKKHRFLDKKILIDCVDIVLSSS